jgi:hypothetical protein
MLGLTREPSETLKHGREIKYLLNFFDELIDFMLTRHIYDVLWLDDDSNPIVFMTENAAAGDGEMGVDNVF